MRKSFVVVGVAAAALLGAAAWRQMQIAEQTQRAAPTQTENASASDATTAVAGAASQTPAVRPESPQVSEHEARMDFHNRVRTFFAQAPAMSADDKAAQARTLDADIERYRAAGELSAAEAFTLRLGLVRESAPADEQQARMEALRDEYRARSASAAPTSDPMFELYKARESEIVTQVQAMESVPDGLSRDEYLRQALQKEREALLGN